MVDWIKEMIELANTTFYEEKGRDKCKHGAVCLACSMMTCSIQDIKVESSEGRTSITSKSIGWKFEPKEELPIV